MSARVIGTGGDGTTEIVGGGVVDRIYTDGPPPYSRTQRIDKRLSDPPTPRGSVVPRANTTSTSEQGVAAADGRDEAAVSGAHAATTAAPSRPEIGRAVTACISCCRFEDDFERPCGPP
jgi:hypothetical protein